MIIVSYLSHLIIMILKMVMVVMDVPSVIWGRGGGALTQKMTPTWRRSPNFGNISALTLPLSVDLDLHC